MSTTPISSGSSNPAVGENTPPVRVPKQVLDANDFMKLLSVQLQFQDPMKPMDNNEQMAQVAQMSSMQSIAQMAVTMAQLNSSQSLVLANSYLGRQVSLTDADGKVVTGTVAAIENQGASPQVKIGDAYYPLSAITSVELPGVVTTDGLYA